MDTALHPENITLDYFYFSCLETEKLELTIAQKSSAWSEIFTDETSNLAQLLPLDKSLLDRLMAAVVEHYPEFRETTSLNLENLHHFSFGYVAFCRGLQRLSRHLLNDAEQGDIKGFATEVARTYFSHLDGKSLQLAESYLYWSLKRTDIVPEAIGERPPVGRYAPSRYSKTTDRGPSSGRSDRNDRGDRGRGPKPAHKNGSRPRHRDNRPMDKNRPPRKKENPDAKLLPEVLEATKQLMSNPKLTQVPLKPQNSFNRRRQHHLIENEGFRSESEGDGDHRHVVVLRS